MSVADLVQVVLLLVIIWLVAAIRQNLGAPSAGTQVRRAVGALVPPTSHQTPPRNEKLMPLDSIPVEDALEAISKHYGDKSS